MAEIRNLLNDPWPNAVGQWASDSPNDLELRMTADAVPQIYMGTKTANTNLYIRYLPSGNMNGRYVFSVHVTELLNGATTALTVFNRNNWSALVMKEISQTGMVRVIFNAPNVPVQLRIKCGSAAGQVVKVRNLLLMTEEDWTHMRAIKNTDGTPANVRWFAPPKTAATGVLSVPALDRGEVLL